MVLKAANCGRSFGPQGGKCCQMPSDNTSLDVATKAQLQWRRLQLQQGDVAAALSPRRIFFMLVFMPGCRLLQRVSQPTAVLLGVFHM